MNYYEVKLSVFVEAESKQDAIKQVLSLDVSDLDIDAVEEN